MTRDELEHAIRAACDVAPETDLIVFGSQSIPGQYPEAPEALRVSMEVDVDPKHHPERVDAIDGALGEGSPFHRLYGFYVHGVSIETAILPHGWAQRTIPVCNDNTRGNTGHCIEAHDLAASKLAADRPKDREFVRILLREGLIRPAGLRERIEDSSIDENAKARLNRWITLTVKDLNESI